MTTTQTFFTILQPAPLWVLAGCSSSRFELVISVVSATLLTLAAAWLCVNLQVVGEKRGKA